jgi:1,2-phenylacetyl-CoA epoxidase PaaB subunit
MTIERVVGSVRCADAPVALDTATSNHTRRQETRFRTIALSLREIHVVESPPPLRRSRPARYPEWF